MSTENGRRPDLPQERRLVTEIPGPRSRELLARRQAAVARRRRHHRCRCSSTRAGGGVIVDVDGNSLIDFGSGIAVTTVGNAAPARGRAASASRSRRFTHTCFMVTPYEGYVRGVRGARRGSPRATTRSARSCSTPVPRRWRTPSRSPGTPPGGQAVVVFDHAYHGRTLPHDGADRQEHALQARASGRSRPRSTGCRWPTRSAGRPARSVRRGGAAAGDRPRSTSRSAPRTSPP